MEQLQTDPDGTVAVAHPPRALADERDQLTVLNLALLEDFCSQRALKAVNEGRDARDRVGEEDEKVLELTEELFQKTVSRLKISLPVHLEGLARQQGSSTRSRIRSIMDELVSNAAARKLDELELSSSGDLETNFNIQQQLRIHPSSADVMLGGGSPFDVRSPYAREHIELGLLGRGGYGSVYKVRHILDNQEYAIKKIQISGHRLQRYLAQQQFGALVAEVRSLAALHHTNVVRYFHAWTEDAVETVSNPLIKSGLSGTLSMSESFEESGASSLWGNSRNHGFDRQQYQFGDDNDHDDLGDGIVFGHSSHSESHEITSKRDRSTSQVTTSSANTFRASMKSVGEDTEDDSEDVETIPRFFSNSDHTSPKELLAMKKSSEEQNVKYNGPDKILCIKMAYHPLTLESYLSPDTPQLGTATDIRHCFHQEPSIEILSALLDGIQYIHSQSFVHRDLKPANIFISLQTDRRPLHGSINIRECRQCKKNQAACPTDLYITPHIGDFGLCAELKAPSSGLPSSSSSATEPHFEPSPLAMLHPRPVGTTFYRPATVPEKDPICAKLDVYSLGIIAFELLWKFDTKSERAMLLHNLNQGIIPPSFTDHNMAEGILAMICPDRDRRWDCAAVKEWLGKMGGK